MTLTERDYRRKLYALLQVPQHETWSHSLCEQLSCWGEEGLGALSQWWQEEAGIAKIAQDIASSSDRVNLGTATANNASISTRHPISGEHGTVAEQLPPSFNVNCIPASIRSETNAQKVFWWFWRFYPEIWLNSQSATLSDGLLYPAHRILPDCPLHSYQSTVSALVGALLPEDPRDTNHPYLLIFTFSPIQDFIKASRKFLDFWAGSYLLHYLSARLCWHIAQQYGPDAIIVPSLWGQDIVDTFLVEHYKPAENGESSNSNADPEFYKVLQESFRQIDDARMPVERFNDRLSTSLSTAGFPNVITALIPGKKRAMELGEELAKQLRQEWVAIGHKIRDHIRSKVSQEATNLSSEQNWSIFWAEVKEGLPRSEKESAYKSDLEKWRSRSDQFGNPTYPNWEWNELWDQQLNNAWEPYWATVPLGDPKQKSLSISKQNQEFDLDWKTAQSTLSQAWVEIPSPAEEHAFDTLNVGTWWGSFQQRLRIAIQTVKNTRTWKIPVAPGARSTISGQYSAVHPNLNYRKVNRRGSEQDFREGAGVPEGSMRLFWLLMAKTYPGLFDGSECLNALELTKRMGWIYGGVAESLGIEVNQVVTHVQRYRSPSEEVNKIWRVSNLEQLLYDRFVRFPNLSSIAAARFIRDNPELTRQYCSSLKEAVGIEFGSRYERVFQRTACARRSHIPQADQHVNPQGRFRGYLNGAMFSAKWLAEDMDLELNQTQKLRSLVEQAHKENHFGGGSPSDWWAVVLADGDGMGQYISGSKLEVYKEYLVDVDTSDFTEAIAEAYQHLREKTQKRMGPATHVGLNRALLDFSNRLVPYLTEKRFCGKVIYSGGDDVMAVLPLEDLPEYLRSLRAAWSGKEDPKGEFDHGDGYWRPKPDQNGIYPEGVPKRPLFTMGNTATMSMGVVIAHKSVPLPTVLENLWVAEGDRAKEMTGKDGICFRVIYSSGNTLEALMKGHLLETWWEVAQHYSDKLSPVLYRLAKELPKRVDISHPDLFPLAAQVIMHRRDEDRKVTDVEKPLQAWLEDWATWAKEVDDLPGASKLGATSDDLGYLLRFTAFWVDKMVQRQQWKKGNIAATPQPTVIGG